MNAEGIAQCSKIATEFETDASESLRDPHDLGHALGMFEALRENAVFIGVYDSEVQEFVGCLAAVVFPNLFTGVVEANEVLWFVSKKARGCGLRLFKLFEQWAHDKGAKYATVCHMVDSMPETVGGFYNAVGYSKQDIIYRKEL